MTTLAWGDQDPRIRRAVQQVLDQLVLGKGLRRDKNGKIELAVSGRSPFYFEGEELQLRAADGLVVSPGSPTALRVDSIDSDKVRETSASSTSVSSSLRRLTNAIATINATIATLDGASISRVSVDFTDGDTAKRVSVSDATITATDKILVTVRRPDMVDDSEDSGHIYITNIVRIYAGGFDVRIVALDLSGMDPTEQPPNETIELQYQVAA